MEIEDERTCLVLLPSAATGCVTLCVNTGALYQHILHDRTLHVALLSFTPSAV